MYDATNVQPPDGGIHAFRWALAGLFAISLTLAACDDHDTDESIDVVAGCRV